MNNEILESINLLKDLVKESHIKGQMHIDFTLAPASRHDEYKNALAKIRELINSGELKEEIFKEMLGLV